MKAGSLRELREIIATVSNESIFHHTYQYFLYGHILEYTNDFAQWAGERQIRDYLAVWYYLENDKRNLFEL